jgi:hypothetical protein
MARNRHSSPIPSSIPDEDVNGGAETDPSGAEWSGPENQLGLEPDDLFGFRRDDDQAVGLEKKGEINYETIVKYLKIYIDCTGDDLKKTATNIHMKLSSVNRKKVRKNSSYSRQ